MGARPLLVALACFGIGGWLLAQGLKGDSPAHDVLGALLDDVRDPYWGILYVLPAYALSTLVFLPITGVFVATCAAVGATRGFVYCLVGGLFSASLSYLVGRLLGAGWTSRLRHRALDKLRSQMATRPIRSVLIARFLPIGNFTLINLALGSFRVRYSAFMIGNVLGMTPGILIAIVLAGLLDRALHAPDWKHLVLVAAGGLLAVLMLYAVSRRLTQKRLLQNGVEDESDLPDELTPE